MPSARLVGMASPDATARKMDCAAAMNLSNPAALDEFATHATSSMPSLAMAGILAIVSWICFYLLVVKRRKQRQLRGPVRWPVVGSYFEVVRNFPMLHDWLLSYFSNGCKTIAVDWGTFYNVLTVDPANVEYMLKTNFANYPKGELMYERNFVLMGDGIFNSDGEGWKRHRKVASYEFSPRKLHDFSAKVFKKHAIQMMEVLDVFARAKDAAKVDFQDICMRMTLDSICDVGFGVQMGFLSSSLPAVPFATSFDRVNELVVRRSVGPIWKLLRALNLGSERELREHIRELDSFTFKVIRSRRKEIEEYARAGRAFDKEDLLSRFMTASSGQHEDESYQDKELRDAILNFVIAGRDTTAITLSWFVYCICTNPHVARNIYSEMERVVHNFHEVLTFDQLAEALSVETLSKLHYLHAAITETLRLYPAVPRDSKLARADDVLPDGTVVRKGDTVTYVPYSMGRMEFLWGPDAMEFKPERWMRDSQFHPESPFKFTAFQAGPRICLGKDSAYLQMKITAAMLMRFFKFELVQDEVVHYRILMVLAMLNGIKVKVSRL